MIRTAIIYIIFYFSYVYSDPSEETRFKNFVEKHKKGYEPDSQNWRHRFEIYKKKLHYIDYINSQNLTYTLGENKFTDMSIEEFKSVLISESKLQEAVNLNSSKVHTPHENSLRFLSTVPGPIKNYDWQEYNTPVKDQGECGSCWSFASVGAIEHNFNIKYNSTNRLSEQELVDCSSDFMYGNSGCNGGGIANAFNYVNDYGISRSIDYPYLSKNGSCSNSDNTKPIKITGYSSCPSEMFSECQFSDWQELLSNGPMAVGYYVYIDTDENSDFMNYKSGIYDKGCPTVELNHALLVVGYNQTENVVTLKNSWGIGWGENGYIRMKINRDLPSNYSCGVTKLAYYPHVALNNNCSILYDEPNFLKGNTKIICSRDKNTIKSNLTLLKSDDNDAADSSGINFTTKSILLAPQTNLTIFNDSSYGGSALVITANKTNLNPTNKTFFNGAQSIIIPAVNLADICITLFNTTDNYTSRVSSFKICYNDTQEGYYDLTNDFNNKARRIVIKNKISSVALYDKSNYTVFLYNHTASANFSFGYFDKASSIIMKLKPL